MRDLDHLKIGDRVRLDGWPSDITGRVAGVGTLDGSDVIYLVRLKRGGWLGDDAGRRIGPYVTVLACSPGSIEPLDQLCSVCRRRHGEEVEHACE